jgi:hypothetical protein
MSAGGGGGLRALGFLTFFFDEAVVDGAASAYGEAAAHSARTATNVDLYLL